MKEIISKKHNLKFYLSLVISCLLLLSLATLFLREFLFHSDNNYLYPRHYFILGVSVLMYLFVAYTVYAYFRNAPRIKVNSKSITFSAEEFLWTDIAHIELLGKSNFPFLGKFYMEAATFSFKSGANKVLFDDMYSNTWEIKSFIKMAVIDKQDFLENISEETENNLSNDEYCDTFKGYQLTSLRGLILWGLLGSFLAMILLSKRQVNIDMVFFILGISFLVFIIFSYQMHYFLVSNQYLIVRNHNLFWIKRDFKLSDIREVVFETQGKNAISLRVITKNFKTNLYPAGTLKITTWRALKNKLESIEINVRNECI